MVCEVHINVKAPLPLILSKDYSTSGNDQIVGVVGNLKEIGSWNLENALILKPKDLSQHIWEATFNAANPTNIQYRYFIGVQLKSGDKSPQSIVISKWEAHLRSRTVTVSEENAKINLNDTFGLKDGEKHAVIDEGWLTYENEFRFSISSPKNSPFLEVLNENSNQKKSTPPSSCIKPEASSAALSFVLTTITPFGYVEAEEHKDLKVKIPTTSDIHYVFTVKTLQPQNDYVRFHITSEKDQKLGTAVLAFCCLPKSKGIIKVPVVNEQQAVVAVIRVAYLCVKPFSFPLPLKYCFTRHWKSRPMLHVGHRGSGNSFTSKKLSNVWENTLASFNQASKSGAHYLEFDVHLTKDEVPIVYHDLTTCVIASSIPKNASLEHNLMQLPVHNLTFKELQSLKMRHKSRFASRALNFDETSTDVTTQPFPTLKKLFEEVPANTGFNVEVKWPTLDETHEYEDGMEHYFDANLFVDSILKVVYQSAKSRKVIFSCFDVDICIMLRRKQNTYPVLFLTNGDTKHYTPLLDLREATNAMAIGTAKAEGFLGIDTLDKDVYLNPDIVKKTHEAGLIFACYGDDVGDNLDKLKQAQVDIAIYDRIHENRQLRQDGS